VLISMRGFVVERETAIGVITLLVDLLLNPQERVDIAGAGGLLLGGEEKRPIDFSERKSKEKSRGKLKNPFL